MPRYLLDTHVLIWWLEGSEKLSSECHEIIRSGENAIYFSAGAIWEMVIKRGLGRLDMPDNLDEVLKGDNIEVLPITAGHALGVGSLPQHHHDPFDRIQIAQARHENLVLVSRDEEIAKYSVKLLRA